MHIAMLTVQGFNELDSFIAKTQRQEAARRALHDVAPVGDKDAYVALAMGHVAPCLAGRK